MPNWFYFTVNVSGEKKDVEQFVENVKGSEKYETEGREFDFNHFIPQPDNIFRENIGSQKKQELDAIGVPNWYDWNNANWGTKWNANVESAFVLESNDETMEYEYEISTAWAFPNPVIKAMIDKYPNLDFTIVGAEEGDAYGVYIVSSEDIWDEEEPMIVDEHTDREVYFEGSEGTWRYLDDDALVPDQDDFYPMAKYSWS